MRVWIDICHTPQYNFFKPVIEELARRGHEVYVTVLNRGKTPKIVAKELEGLEHVCVEVLGKHQMTKWSAIWNANLMRVCKLIHWARGKKLDVAISTNIFTPLVGGLFGMKSFSFGDDPQVWDFHPKGWLSTKAYQTLYEWTMDSKQPKHTEVLRCLKEWAYLNPRTFVPNPNVLDKYGVKPKEYMFLREVTVGTINYTGQESGAILGIKDLMPKGMKVLFSLEEKKRRGEYPDDWILLQEPIEDIHSLIYYAAGLVSSGDSMAREAALLGVPAYYLGIRYSMPANAAASKVASLQNQKTMPFAQWIEKVNELRNEGVERLTEEQIKLRQHIDEEFIDINQYMLGLVEGV
jgi:predicted glycosyltransferase